MRDSSVKLTVEELRTAIAGLEAQRATLSDAVVEPALIALRSQLAQAENATPTPDVRESPVERRIVTAMFADIVGSTALTEKLDPEEWRDLVTEIHAIGSRHIAAHSGVVMQYLGDGLLAVFGAHGAGERDAENAVRAALDIQAGMATRTGEPAVRLRIGIDTGVVVLGDLPTGLKPEFTASGTAMNLAARLQGAALPGQILISQDTYRYVKGLFQFVPQPLLTLKGQTNPLQTFQVLEALPRPFDTRNRGVDGSRSGLFGRTAELKLLRGCLTESLDSGAPVWAQIIGEAGIGKSRLLSEIRTGLQDAGKSCFVLKARAYQGDEHQAFALVRRMWFDQFGIAEDTPRSDAERIWNTRFRALAGAVDDDGAQVLGMLVGLPYTQYQSLAPLRDDPVQLRGRAWVVSQSLFESMQRRMPVVIFLEDLQWADPSSVEYLIAHLLNNRYSSNGIFVLATARTDWTYGQMLETCSGYRRIDLPSLDDNDCRHLVSSLLQNVAGVTDDVVRLIAQRSEGNPLYAEEIVNWCIDHGVIVRAAGKRSISAEGLTETTLPLTLQHLLQTRIGTLRDHERSALQIGSVFGRNFWEGGLEELGVRDAGQILARLQGRGLVEPAATSALAGDREWMFRHQILRDATYESLLKSERRRLHRAAAGWLEKKARRSDRLDEFVHLIGEHADRCGDVEMAVVWLLRAGDRAKARGATVGARKYYERVLQLLPPDDQTRRWSALLGLSDVLRVLGDTSGYHVTVSELTALAHRLDDAHLSEAHYRQGFYNDYIGDYAAAVNAYRAGAECAHRAGQTVLEAELQALAAICLNRRNETTAAAACAARAIQLSEQAGRNTTAKALSNLAVYYAESGDIGHAAILHAEQAQINNQSGDRAAEANALGNLGYDYISLGLYEKGIASLKRSVELCEATGARRELVYNRLNLILAFWRSRRLDEAMRSLDALERDLASLGDGFARAVGQTYRGLILESAGQHEPAMAQYRLAAEALALLGVSGYAVDARSGLGRCTLSAGQPQEAGGIASIIWEYLNGHGAAGMEFPIWSYLTCAQIFRALGEMERYSQAVKAGYAELIKRSGRISTLEWRQSYLESVPEHRQISDLHRASFGAAR